MERTGISPGASQFEFGNLTVANKVTASSSRIGDHPLALNLTRYTHSDMDGDDALWVWSISKYCRGAPIARIADVKLADLEKMRDVISEHIKMLENDGGHAARPDPFLDA